MSLRRLRAAITDDWFCRTKRQYILERDVALAPLKDKDTVGLEYAQTLTKAFGQVIAPTTRVKLAVVIASPAAISYKMWWVKNYQVKAFIRER